MSHQRRRGQWATVLKTKVVEDSLGNEHMVPDPDNTERVKAWLFPQRSSKAEVAGQQHINVIRIGVPPIEGVDLWSRVEFMGKSWDVAAPPAYHYGASRVTRHWSIDLRERP